ncbi:MAG TPA: DNA polymerase III subunit gamma/tau [Ktedonobacterales bacterium]
MASQSLYRKWRSQTFADLIGQEAVTRTLLNAVREGRLAHAYLFCGPRGTGKTSVARLLAKAINCENPQNGEPCNVCVSCREIAEGRSPDVIEIDAASNNGVDDIRNIRENAGLIGSGGRYKVYVVDECHMLSTPAFNALLKTLEEPPPHVIFVLATTEAHKVLPTVVSRCQRFDFRRISLRDIVARLEQVAQGEGLELDASSAEVLARTAQGGMRDALSLLDQAVAFCGAKIDITRTRAMLGLADVTALRRLIACVAEERAADGLEIINDLVTTGAELRQLNSQLAEEWRALMLARAGGDLTRLMEYTAEEAQELSVLAERFSLEQLMACARVFSRNEGPARGLPLPQMALELAFLECVSVRRGVGAMVVTAAPQPPAPAPVTPRAEARPEPPRAATPAKAHAAEELDLASIDAGTWTGPAADANHAPPAPQLSTLRPAAVEVPAQPERPTTRSTGAGSEVVEEARRQWSLIRKICKQKAGLGSTVYGLLNDAEPVRLEPGSPPTLIMAARHDFHLKSLRDDAKRVIVEWALEQALGAPYTARFIAAGEGLPGAAAAPARRADAPSRVVSPSPGPVREHAASYRAAGPEASNGHNPRPPVEDHPVTAAGPAMSSDPVALDELARQDPMVLEFMRHGLEVAEIRPLDATDGEHER